MRCWCWSWLGTVASLLLLLLLPLEARLVRKPELRKAYYCGIEPGDPDTYHSIPPVDDPDMDIVQVQAYIRHGDRMFWGGGAGDWCWPGQENTEYHCELTHNSVPGTSLKETTQHEGSIFRKVYLPHRNDYNGNCRVGQLSLKGHRQEVINGEAFRRAYIPGLLSDTYQENEVHFRSDDEPRTLLSAESFIQGLYPEPKHGNDGQLVINLFTMDKDRDDMTANSEVCPGYSDNVAKAKASDLYRRYDASARADLYPTIASVFGVDEDTISDGARQFDCVFASACRGSELPEGVTEDLMRAMDVDQTFRFYYPIRFPSLNKGTRLSGGPLIREMYRLLQAAQTQQPLPKLFLFSGHDTGPIMLLLSAFQSHEPRWVPYASFISLELYRSRRDPTRFFVRAVFNGKVLRLPGCADALCPFDTFSEHIEPMVPSSEECPNSMDTTAQRWSTASVRSS